MLSPQSQIPLCVGNQIDITCPGSKLLFPPLPHHQACYPRAEPDRKVNAIHCGTGPKPCIIFTPLSLTPTCSPSASCVLLALPSQCLWNLTTFHPLHDYLWSPVYSHLSLGCCRSVSTGLHTSHPCNFPSSILGP